MSFRALALLSIPLALAGSARAVPQAATGRFNANGTVNFMDHVGVDQRLGETIDLSLRFRDEEGAAVTLGEYFDERPVLLVLAYYECPMLCTLVLNGMTRSLRTILDLDVGEEFEVVVVSIDPTETPELARAKRDSYAELYARAGGRAGWHFLVGDEPAIAALAKQVGFRYVYDQQGDEYAHAAAIMVATPTGRLSSYFYGVEFVTKDLRLGLIEASSGRIGTLADRVLLLCYHYDPSKGKYGFAIMGAMRLLGGATVVALLGGIALMLRRDRQEARIHVD